MTIFEKVVVEFHCISCNHVYVKLTWAEVGENHIPPETSECNVCGKIGNPTGHVSYYDRSRTHRASADDLPNIYDTFLKKKENGDAKPKYARIRRSKYKDVSKELFK